MAFQFVYRCVQARAKRIRQSRVCLLKSQRFGDLGECVCGCAGLGVPKACTSWCGFAPITLRRIRQDDTLQVPSLDRCFASSLES
jgi:hypothetical protein